LELAESRCKSSGDWLAEEQRMRQEIEQLEREVQKRDACSKLEKQELSLRYERRMQEE